MNNEDKQGFIILFVLIFVVAILTCIVINTIRAKSITYEYFIGEKVGKSNECYSDKKDITY